MSSQDDLSRWFQSTSNENDTTDTNNNTSEQSPMPSGIEIPVSNATESDDGFQFVTASGDGNAPEEQPMTMASRKPAKESTEILSREDILEMRSTEHLFSNELWKLTFDEMLKVIVSPSVRKRVINGVLSEIGDAIMATEEDDEDEAHDASETSSLQMPKKLSQELLCEDFIRDAKHKKQLEKILHSDIFEDLPPIEDLNIIGSYLLKANLNRPHVHVDLGIEMPQELLSDLLDADSFDVQQIDTYYQRRFVFLVVMYHNLKEKLVKNTGASRAINLQWKLFRELDQMKPYIQMEVQIPDNHDEEDQSSDQEEDESAITAQSNKFYVNIYPMVAQSQQDTLDHLLASMNQQQQEESQNALISHLLHGVWEDIHPMDHLNIFHSTSQEWPTLIQTLCLLKVWSRLRGMLYKCDGVNGYAWACILVHLAEREVIDSSMSPYQIFKITLRWVIALRMDVPIILGQQESVDDQNLPNVQRLYKAGDSLVFLFDSSDEFNAFHRVSHLSWKELVYECSLTLNTLNSEEQNIEYVQSTFTSPHNHFRKYDLHVVIENFSQEESSSIYHAPRRLTFEKLTNVLYHSLADRCDSIRIIGNAQDFLSDEKNSVVIGIILSSEWQETIVRGPSRSGHEVTGLEKILIERFQSIWKGDAKLLDTTLDTNMIYGVDWDEMETAREAHTNPVYRITEITNYMLKKHFTSKKSSPTARLSGDFLYNHYYISKSVQNDLKFAYDDALLLLRETLDTIDVNLQLQDVIGISSEYRGCALAPVLLNAHLLGDEEVEDFSDSIISHSTNVTPLRVILDFDEKSKWPLTPEACHKLKTYIYTVYHEGLADNHIFSKVHESYLDAYLSGFILRIQIRLPQEVNRYKTSGHIMNPYVIALDRDVSMLPVHSAYIQNFIRHYPQYTHVCRLAKRWVNAHLFGLDMPEALIELLVAYSCYTSQPYRPSKSSLLCFYNFIHLLANFPWSTSPLFVNLQLDPDNGTPYYTDEDKEKMQQICTEFQYNPNKAPLYVVASYAFDDRNFWTKFDFPSSLASRRMLAIAKRALRVFDALLEDDISAEGTDSEDWKILFQASFQPFDTVVNIAHLNDVPQGLYFEPEGLPAITTDKDHFIDKEKVSIGVFPPVDFARRLKERLSRFGAFFLDPCRPTTLGIAWNPEVMNEKRHPLKLNQLDFMKPTSEKETDTLQVNKEAIYAVIGNMSVYKNKKATLKHKSQQKNGSKKTLLSDKKEQPQKKSVNDSKKRKRSSSKKQKKSKKAKR